MAKMQIAFLLSAIIAVTYSKKFGESQYDTNGVCVRDNKTYNSGQEWFSNDCKKYKCVKGSTENEMILEEEKCNYEKPEGKNCEVKIIPGKNYPECCSSEIVCDENRPTQDAVRVERAAGGGYDPYWAQVDQGWRNLDRQRAQYWQQYGQSWRDYDRRRGRW